MIMFMASTYLLTEHLLRLGLTEKEAGVYLSLLELGRGTVSQVARKAGINRTTGYDILDSLVRRGLGRVSGKQPKQEYVAEGPEKIIQMINTEIDQRKKMLESAKQLVAELTPLHNQTGRPKVMFYEGVDGLKEVYEDTLTSREDLRSLALVDEAERTMMRGYFPKYYQRRADKGIAIRAIFPDSPGARNLKKKDKIEKRTSVIIPGNDFDLKPEINVYDNKVMIASWSEKLGIIIESEQIANAVKLLFELAWKEAKRNEKKT